MQTCTEKELTVMMKSYHSALHLLKNQQTSEGTVMLLSILDGPLIDDADLRNLKYSTLLSLAEVKLVQG